MSIEDQRTSGNRGIVGIKDQWTSEYRGPEEQRNRETVGTEDQWVQRTGGYRGPEKQWEQRTSGYRGPVQQWAQRTRETVGTEDQWVQRTSGYIILLSQIFFCYKKKNDTTYLVDKMFVTSIIRTIIKCEEIKLSCQNNCYDILKTKKLAIC